MRVLYWAPRILCLLFIPFLMLFSLDVFEEAHGFKEIAVGLIMHNLPAFALIGFLWLAWKWEWIGAVVFTVLGGFYIWLSWGKFNIWAKVVISGPLFVIGVLFLLNWIWRRERNPRPGQVPAR